MQNSNLFRHVRFLILPVSLFWLAACQVATETEPTPSQSEQTSVTPIPTEPPSEENNLETEASAVSIQQTATPAQTFAPIIQQPSEPTASGYWSYFSNPGGGGAFHTVGQGPDGLVIVTSDLSGAYLNRAIDDPSSRWEIIGLDRGLSATHVSAVGFHPTDPQLLFLGTDNGIFRSADGANTFTKVFADGYFHDIVIVAANGQSTTCLLYTSPSPRDS